jgi:hypothetical protein
MPRATEGVAYGDTYPELIQTALRSGEPHLPLALYNRSSGGITIDKLFDCYLSDSFYFGQTPQYLIIQCGIVDCAPRPIPRIARNLLSMAPGPLRLVVARGLHHARPYLLRAGIKWHLTGPRRFRSILSRFLGHAVQQCERTFVYNIAPTLPELETHSPGLRESIAAYNLLIEETVRAVANASIKLIDVYSAICATGKEHSYVSIDGIHLTAAGHRLYAQRLLEAQQRAAHEQISFMAS